MKSVKKASGSLSAASRKRQRSENIINSLTHFIPLRPTYHRHPIYTVLRYIRTPRHSATARLRVTYSWPYHSTILPTFINHAPAYHRSAYAFPTDLHPYLPVARLIRTRRLVTQTHHRCRSDYCRAATTVTHVCYIRYSSAPSPTHHHHRPAAYTRLIHVPAYGCTTLHLHCCSCLAFCILPNCTFALPFCTVSCLVCSM